jgi:hypothetical protein
MSTSPVREGGGAFSRHMRVYSSDVFTYVLLHGKGKKAARKKMESILALLSRCT